MHKIAPPSDTHWLCMGDFNEIFWSWEKSGGNNHRTRSMEAFWETSSTLGLQDLGFSGSNFTWSNGRTGDANILVRLDRALASAHWRSMFPGAGVIHLPRLNSDHSPILVWYDYHGGQGGRRTHGKRTIQNCGERLKKWDRAAFENVSRNIKITRDRIEMLLKKPQSEAIIRESQIYQCIQEKEKKHNL
ncbi:hypothetical protein ACS0TY_014658 [Phlomoides rotata]